MKRYEKLNQFKVEKDELSKFLLSCHFDIGYFTRFPIQSNKALNNIMINKFKIILLEKGKFNMMFKNESYDIHENNVVLIPPMCLHSATTGDEDIISYELFFNFKEFSKECELINLLNLDEPKILKINPDAFSIASLFKIYEDHQKHSNGSYLEVSFLICKILIAFSDAHDCINLANIKESSAIIIVDKMINFVEKNYMHPITVYDICNELKVSQSYLYRCSQSVLKLSPNNYILYFKMAKAERLLKDFDLSVDNVAKQTGFENIYYFSNTFKKHFGFSPSAYRQQFI